MKTVCDNCRGRIILMKKILGNLLAACMCGFLVNVPATGFTQAVWPEQGVPEHQELLAKV